MIDGIVLDDTTAPLVPEGSALTYGPLDHPSMYRLGMDEEPDPGEVLVRVPTPTGLRPVGEVVADVDRADAAAAGLRSYLKRRSAKQHSVDPKHAVGRLDVDGGEREVLHALDALDALDAIHACLLAPELVQAWHDQHPGDAKGGQG